MRNSHFTRWGAAYVLFVLFLASWIGQFITTAVVRAVSNPISRRLAGAGTAARVADRHPAPVTTSIQAPSPTSWLHRT